VSIVAVLAVPWCERSLELEMDDSEWKKKENGIGNEIGRDIVNGWTLLPPSPYPGRQQQ